MQDFDPFIGCEFTTLRGGKLTVVGSLPKAKNKPTEYIFCCSICSDDAEMWPHGSITGTKRNATVQNVCGCSVCPAYTEAQQYTRMKRLAPERGYVFSGFSGGFSGSSSKCILSCSDHGEWITTNVNKFLAGRGCPACGMEASHKQRRPNRKIIEEKIKRICDLEGIQFIGWKTESSCKKSKIILKCDDHGPYDKSLERFIDDGKRCPCCTTHGFNRSKKGFMYMLESDCKNYLKIGISNKPAQRLMQLRRATPFKFEVLSILEMDGYLAHDLELEVHSNNESAGLSGFDGFTEWLINKPQIIEYIQQRAM